jgi:hypothetical protein
MSGSGSCAQIQSPEGRIAADATAPVAVLIAHGAVLCAAKESNCATPKTKTRRRLHKAYHGSIAQKVCWYRRIESVVIGRPEFSDNRSASQIAEKFGNVPLSTVPPPRHTDLAQKDTQKYGTHFISKLSEFHRSRQMFRMSGHCRKTIGPVRYLLIGPKYFVCSAAPEPIRNHRYSADQNEANQSQECSKGSSFWNLPSPCGRTANGLW